MSEGATTSNSSLPLDCRSLAAGDGLELLLPKCEKGIGKIIRKPDSPDLIAGVRLRPYSIWPDDRGYFAESLRTGQGLAADFPADRMQVSMSLSYKGTVKAFHYHLRQIDCWGPAEGMFQIALVELRKGSPTFGLRNTFYAGSLWPVQVLVPPGVGHGYKVIGGGHGFLVYVTNRFYDPNDEGRIPYDDPSINYDWETQHK